jgi:asparagine N-glycosylation enzyme membrane subunit Stt3
VRAHQGCAAKQASDSLDVCKQASATVSVVATRLENLGVSGSQLAVGLGLVFIALVVYLVIPLAFVIRDCDLNSLIIVVVMGLVTLSTAAQGLLEKALVYCMMALTPDMRFISLVLCSRLPSRLSCS